MLVPKLTAAVFAAMLLGGAADATSFVGDYTVAANFADPGLAVRIDTDAGVGGDQHVGAINLDLALGVPQAIFLFDIFSAENSVDVLACPAGDTCAKPISVAFDLTPALTGGSFTGATVGAFVLLALQEGQLVWDDGDQDFAFGNGGVLNIQLNNTTFGTKLFGVDQGTPGTVYATFTLVENAVPEPANWAMMIAGFGLIGGALRHRRGRNSVSFA